MKKVFGLFILTCVLFFSLFDVSYASSDDGIVWKKTSDMYFNNVAFDGQQYVGVSKKGIYTSTDLVTWEYVRSGDIYLGLTDINWNGKQFIAFANWGDTYIISPDGKTWTYEKLDANYMIFDIFWDGQKYFLLGQSTIKLPGGYLQNGDKITILSSFDGITWTKGTVINTVKGLGMDKWQDSIAYNGNMYLTVGGEGATTRSLDGVNWTGNANKYGTADSGIDCNFGKVIWNGSDFVAAGTTYYRVEVFRSKDGIKWNKVYKMSELPEMPHTFFTNMAFNGSKYVIAGKSFERGDIHTGFMLESSDSENWTKSFQYQYVDLKDQGINRHYSARMISNGNKFILFGEGGVFLGEAPAPIQVILNGNSLSFDVNPRMINERVMVPMRAIFEALGATVEWDNSTNTVTARKDSIVLNLQKDSAIVKINGNPITIDAPVQVINGRTFVPIRYIAEWLGAKVDWDTTNRIVTINQ